MKYLLTLFGPEGGMEDASPEEMKAEMDRWAAYSQEAVDKGAFVAGEGLQPSATATTVRIPRTAASAPSPTGRSRSRRSSSAASTCSSARTSTRPSSGPRRSRSGTAPSRCGR